MATFSTTRVADTGGGAGFPPQNTRVEAAVLRYGLAFVILWIGFITFQLHEATNSIPLVAEG